MATIRTITNLFWSFRKYLYTSGYGTPTGVPTYYNPTMRPSNVADRFLIVMLQDERPGKMTHSFPRIYCVSKNDPESVELIKLVSGVVDKFDHPSTGKRYLNFYNEATGAVVGKIEVVRLRVRPVLPYEPGFIHRAVDLELQYEVQERHL